MDAAATVTPGPAAGAPAGAVRSERSQARRETLAVLLRKPGFLIGIGILAIWAFCAIAGEAITPYDPFNDFARRHLPPSPEHFFGTDRLGRDVFSRVIVGARDVLLVAPIAALVGVVAGTLLGLTMGYYRGMVDDAISSVGEALL